MIDKLLSMDPNKRPNCEEALKHNFFSDIPSSYVCSFIPWLKEKNKIFPI